MQDVNLENKLIIVDIADRMLDYVNLQPDIDETKVKSASIIAQRIDIQRVIGAANVQRAIDPQDESDENLKQLLIPTICYFTYARLLKMFQGTYTESGLTIDKEATDIEISKKVANETSSVAEAFLVDVVDFLEEENSDDENVDATKIHPNIRVFGGQENRGSN